VIARLVLALVVAIVVGLGLTALLGPILVSLAVPIAVVIGDFFVKWGWVIGVLAGLWYFFAGGFSLPQWPHRPS
jgi:uncharacterized membrane protein YvlD (DUF360 family)